MAFKCTPLGFLLFLGLLEPLVVALSVCLSVHYFIRINTQIIAIQIQGYLMKQQHNNTTTNNTTTLQHNSTKTQKHDNTITQQHNTTTISQQV